MGRSKEKCLDAVCFKKRYQTQYGNTKLLTLRERGGKLINESIDEKIDRKRTRFIKSLGLKKPRGIGIMILSTNR